MTSAARIVRRRQVGQALTFQGERPFEQLSERSSAILWSLSSPRPEAIGARCDDRRNLWKKCFRSRSIQWVDALGYENPVLADVIRSHRDEINHETVGDGFQEADYANKIRGRLVKDQYQSNPARLKRSIDASCESICIQIAFLIIRAHSVDESAVTATREMAAEDAL